MTYGLKRGALMFPLMASVALSACVSQSSYDVLQAQYQQARAALRYNRADYYPTLTAGLSATRTGVSAHRPHCGCHVTTRERMQGLLQRRQPL